MQKLCFHLNQDRVRIVWAESDGLPAVLSRDVIFECDSDDLDMVEVKKQIAPHLSEDESARFISKLDRSISLSKRIDPTRTEIQKVRLTKGEKDNLVKRAGMMSASAYMRACAIYTPPVSIPEINAETLTELRRIGTNLNQIARHANETLSADISTVTSAIASLRLALMTPQK